MILLTPPYLALSSFSAVRFTILAFSSKEVDFCNTYHIIDMNNVSVAPVFSKYYLILSVV